MIVVHGRRRLGRLSENAEIEALTGAATVRPDVFFLESFT